MSDPSLQRILARELPRQVWGSNLMR
jgi:hypothetical protein